MPAKVGRTRVPGKGPGKNSPKKKEPKLPATRARMQVRVMAIAMIVALIFVVLVFRLWHLQVLTGDEYSNTAQETQTRSVKIPAQRGVIYDRNGEVLANNQPGLNVTIVPDSIGRADVEELTDVLKADKEAVLANYDAAIQSGNQYSPILVKENASREDVMYVSERTEQFKGLVVNDDYVRNYPNKELAAHVLGYTGAVTENELGTASFEGLSNDSVVGKSGLELAYEKILRGEPGSKNYTVDALGREVAVRRADGRRYDGSSEEIPELGQPASITDPVPGKDLALTIDMDLQKKAEDELEGAIGRSRDKGNEGTGGAVIALDPANGEVLAMAGRPTFDPQLFVGGITGREETKQYEYLNSEEAHAPFTNRAIAGGYPAASSFKVFTGMAGLEFGAISPGTTYTDTGECWRPAGSVGGCWQSWRENSPKYNILGPHGTQNYAQALGDSNNKFFYQVADWMWNRTDDENTLPKFYEKFGFGQATGVDLAGEFQGRVPTRQWQEGAGGTPDDKLWTVGRWVNLSIGQGDLLVTPLQLIRGYSAIANGGSLVTPHVGKEIRDQSGSVMKEISPEPAGQVGVSPSTLQETIRGMRMVTGKGGTAESSFEGSPLKAVGKSGTGEMWGHGNVNWFIGWDESQSHPILVLVMIEGGGAFESGSELTAAPAVRNILEYYYGLGGKSSKKSPSKKDEQTKSSDPIAGKLEETPDGETASAVANSPAG